MGRNGALVLNWALRHSGSDSLILRRDCSFRGRSWAYFLRDLPRSRVSPGTWGLQFTRF